MIIFACLGGLISWLTIPAIERHLLFLNRTGATQAHHAHPRETSRLGGLALLVSFLATSVAVFLWFPLGSTQAQSSEVIVCSATAMFLLGFWDDVKPLGARKKLLGQVLIALAASWYGGIHIENFTSPFSGIVHPLGVAGTVLTVFWLVALTNLINLIDGIDGLAGGIVLMLMGLLCYAGWSPSSVFTALCAAGMAGALVGFLRYNLPPARIFMGDGGAYFLGFLVAELSILNSHKGTIVAGLLAPLFVLALPIVDVSLAILRRGLKGLPIFRPDRRHIHHKLLGVGYTPKRAVWTLYFVTLVFLVFGLIVFWSEGRLAPVLFGVVCLAFIVLAWFFNFSRAWFSPGRVLGNSVELREAIQYALTLSHWLELEAARCDSFENLWADFTFVVLKLNFSKVQLTSANCRKVWQREENARSSSAPRLRFRQEIGGNTAMTLDLEMEAEEAVFSNLCEITSEAWQRALACWETKSQFATAFRENTLPGGVDRRRKGDRPYVPIPLDWMPGK